MLTVVCLLLFLNIFDVFGQTIDSQYENQVCKILQYYERIGPCPSSDTYCDLENILCYQYLGDTVVQFELSSLNLGKNISNHFYNLPILAGILLEDNNMTGTIPTELGMLPNLFVLHVFNNRLTGSIPTHLGNITALSEMWLSDNDLIGSIPKQLSKLRNLIKLDLSSNELGGTIPAELGLLSVIKTLALQDNNFTGVIPTQIGNLEDLEFLNLSYNELSDGTLPTQLGRLTNLNELELSDCSLSGSVPVLNNLISLNKLAIEYNPNLNNIENVFRLTSLKILYLDKVSITSIQNIVRLTRLKELSLKYNDFAAFPTYLRNLTALTKLDLSYNYLMTGTIPDINALENLMQLSLSNSGLSGYLPPGLNDMPNLKTLNFQNTNLSCPRITYKQGSIFLKVCNLNITKDTLFDNGKLYFETVDVDQGILLQGINMSLETQSLGLSSNSKLRLFNSTIAVSGNTTISSLNIILENQNQPVISTTGCINIKANTELNVTLRDELIQPNRTLFSFSCKNGDFAKVRVNGIDCNLSFSNNIAFLTNRCSNKGEPMRVDIFYSIFLILIVLFVAP